MGSYGAVTEVPGLGATREQLSMLLTRYHFASQFCEGKEVLEVACGSGHGLGYLARVARRVVGGDIDQENLRFAEQHYHGRPRIELRRLDAHDLPFPDRSFDVCILFEAIYYLQKPKRFLEECRRVLRSGGVLLLCTANREWADFNPSPLSVRYYSSAELGRLLSEAGFEGEILGAFPAASEGVRGRVLSAIKRSAMTLRLVPSTMKGKRLLKRLFFGKLSPLPPEVEPSTGEYEPPVPLANGAEAGRYKVLYAIGRVGGSP